MNLALTSDNALGYRGVRVVSWPNPSLITRYRPRAQLWEKGSWHDSKAHRIVHGIDNQSRTRVGVVSKR